MPPKRPAEVLVLDSDNEEPTLGPSRPRSSTGAPYGGVNGSSGAASVAPGLDEDAQFEQDIALAMELSLRQTAQAGLLGAAEGVSADLQAAGSSHTFGVGGESRAEMERARLERQRVREMSNPTPPAASTSQGGGSAARPTPRKRFATMADVLQDGSARDRTPRTSSSHGSTQSKTHMRFWDGAVKRVPNDYVPDAEALSFADLIGPASSLQKSVVSAYCLDPFWVASHFEENAPLLLVMPRAQGDTLPTMAPCPVKDNTLRIIPPTNQDLDRAGVMHIKFMIHVHTDFLRIAIPTANAIAYDWSTIDNALYVHDFPLLTKDKVDPSPLKNPSNTQYSRRFIEVCRELGIPKGFMADFRHYDFARSNDVRLVETVQGRWPRADYDKGGGLAALARAVTSFNFAPGGRWEIEATGSSIGRYKNNWLAQMLGAANGIHPASYFRAGAGNQIPALIPRTPAGEKTRLPIRIIFPTEDEILGGRDGAGGGGTLFCPSGTWNENTFPRHLFHRGESKRHKVPAHTKLILGLHKYSSADPPAHEGFMYIGSHNFTPAAWGRLENAAGGPQLKLANWELGVLLPIRASSAEELEKKASDLVTYRRPLVPYAPDERPWQQELHLSQ
ncbi:hypothetical protein BMF94_3458 [Rhodotorula taiwanensis]|uniref:PLD phosphodiesterase domain-containing protein n=1 Tax=Rhodotorula taiwanensis TaxID=741276 RepID=A0A2S5B9X4_9BASI|nr:hypothetical protein BMF94_3458 [Rhodotorula taiwanensis]